MKQELSFQHTSPYRLLYIIKEKVLQQLYLIRFCNSYNLITKSSNSYIMSDATARYETRFATHNKYAKRCKKVKK